MDLLQKIEQLKRTIARFEKITDDLGDNILSKQKKIDHLKEQIQYNAEKIDKIIKNYNADS